MLSENILNDRALHEQTELFMLELADWIAQCLDELAAAEPVDIHDHATFTTGWEPILLAGGGPPETYSFLAALRDKIRDYHVQTDQWHHGYWRMQEAHHGTEHFELFLGAMLRLNSHDGETIRQLDDAAEHFGNWSQEVPEWFDWDKQLFHSMYFGTDGVDLPAGAELNIPDHLRCINICLLAYKATSNKRYLELSKIYGKIWAEAMVASPDVPIGLNKQGVMIDYYDPSLLTYRKFVGEMPENMNNPVDRAENVLASGGIDTFLQLYSLTGEAIYLAGAEKLLDSLVTQLQDPDAGAAVHVLRKYRRMTGNDRYDDHVLTVLRSSDPYEITQISLAPPSRQSLQQPRPSGIGKRSDMPRWYENGKPRRHSPILLAFAAEILQDQALASRALHLATIYIRLARQMFPHGHEHGCTAMSVSSVARGHGRDNHAGMSTAVFQPIWEAFISSKPTF